MAFNGSGVFNRLFSWVADAAAGINISSSRTDSDSNDIAANGFGLSLTRDGQGQPTANLPMATFRHTGVGNGVARTDYAAMGQVQDGVSLNWTTGGGSANAITATYTPALTALVDGQFCNVRATAANTSATPTFAPNGLTAHTITRFGGGALQPGDIAGNNHELILRYNLANTRWELLNPALPEAAGRSAVNDAGYVMVASDQIIAYTAISAARAVTMLAAASYPTGRRLTIIDESGSASVTNTITLNRSGADTINGATSQVINTARGSFTLESDGSSKWTIIGKT